MTQVSSSDTVHQLVGCNNYAVGVSWFSSSFVHSTGTADAKVPDVEYTAMTFLIKQELGYYWVFAVAKAYNTMMKVLFIINN